jgi:hypothetical protein
MQDRAFQAERAIAFLAAGVAPTLVVMVWSVSLTTPFADLIGLFGAMMVNGLLLSLIPIVLTTVTVRGDGVTLRRIWKFRWQEVTNARRRDFLGFRYLQVIRAGSWPATLWLPLGLVGGRPLVVALYDLAPSNNPIHTSLESMVAELRPQSGIP